MRPKPIQIAVSLTRGENEQHGAQVLIVLLDDGEIYERRESDGNEWVRVMGPWNR